jgi:hypothetical protein
MERNTRGQSSILPILLAVGATLVAGWFLKGSPPEEPKGNTPVPRPHIDVQIVDAGAGQPPRALLDQVLRTATDESSVGDVAAWAIVAVLENGRPAPLDSDAFNGLRFSITDDQQVGWPTIAQRYEGHALVLLPFGHDKLPKKLAMEARSRFGGTVKRLDFPLPLPPTRVLSKADYTNDDGLRVIRRQHENSPDTILVVLRFPEQVPEGERVIVQLLADSFSNRTTSPESTGVMRGDVFHAPLSHVAVPAKASEVNLLTSGAGYASPEEVKISVSRYKAYDLRKTIVLKDSVLRSVNGHPSLQPRPGRVKLDANLTIDISSFDPAYRETSKISRTTSIRVQPRSEVESFKTRVIGPTPAETGGISFQIEGATNNPPPLRKLEGFQFEEKRIPVTFQVHARPYRLLSSKTYVLPIQDATKALVPAKSENLQGGRPAARSSR